MTRTQPIPQGMTAVTPHLTCRNANAAMDFYKRAFGAAEYGRLSGPDGKLMHGLINIGGASIMLMDECVEQGMPSPQALNGSPVTLHLYVADVDAAVAQAVDAGAKITMPVADMFWGDRYGRLVDPFGHQWSIATHLRDLTSDEIREAAKAAQPKAG